MSMMKVTQGSYAELFATKLFDMIFTIPENIIKDYRKYYQSEYSNFNDYLFWRYGIERELSKKICGNKCNFLALCKFDFHNEEKDILSDTIEKFLKEICGE